MSKKKEAEIQQERLENEKMTQFFADIWDKTPLDKKICYESGRKLFGEPLTVYFHHVLEKENYPEYKYSTWNIVLVSWIVHDQIHWDIDKTPRVKALKGELLEKHKNGELRS